MSYTPSPQVFSQVDIDTLNQRIQDVLNQLDAMNNPVTALTEDERQAGVTVGIKRKPFNDFYYQNKNNFPNLKPGTNLTQIPEADADKHFFIHSGLTPATQLLNTAFEKLSDMQLNSEHFAFDFARSARMAAKEAKRLGKPGADSWFDALDELFPKTGPDSIDETP